MNRFPDDFTICCFRSGRADCFATISSPFATCNGLFDTWFLKLCAWVISMAAVGTNLLVLIRRIKYRGTAMQTVTSKGAENVFLVNLAVADFLMGVYLMSIATADIRFGQDYFFYSEDWRTGLGCAIIGFIGILSTVVSLPVLTLMTIDRFLCIVFTFGSIRFSKTCALITCAILWVSGVIFTSFPLIGMGFLYGFSDVCVSLPIVQRWDSYSEYSFEQEADEWPYSTILYIYYSSFCLLVVTICYICMFISVKRSRRGSSRHSEARNEDIKLAKRMSIIVGTDMLCWLPVIISGLLSKLGFGIPTELNPWLVVLVIPINSALNPFIYSYAILKGKKKNEKTQTHVTVAVELNKSGQSQND
ncbi:hypothetical protein HOLleu_34947 [Holothuria leucospilota]|uniref:G-protein coupled receptors family 1 profile domain-containing protein n=1 Tax=Holothuria leucospilota TaxID=206669 RepID=A0A9Q0YLZ3_HOLLE|nr:hypothetical protein HOLleu_34947 [Holothuria leucospilota]